MLDLEGKWVKGAIRKHTFVPVAEITKPEDVEQLSDYLTLKQYLRLQGRRIDLADDILRELDAEKIFVLPKSVDKNGNVIFLSDSREVSPNRTICSSCRWSCNTRGIPIYSCSSFQQKMGSK
jgi:hypothetical protein